MEWAAIIALVIKVLPVVISVVMEIIKLINERKGEEKAVLKKALVEAIVKVKETGDLSHLEKMKSDAGLDKVLQAKRAWKAGSL